MKRHTRTAPRAPLPKLTVDERLPHVEGTRAFAAISPIAISLVVNSDVWFSAHDAAQRLFPDHPAAGIEHDRVKYLATGENYELARLLEAAEWSHWHRLLQAAYIVGITVGQRGIGGAR